MKKINNNDLSIKDVSKKVTLYGWIAKKRDLGGMIFIDLRDRSGVVQLVIAPDNASYEIASILKNESVIQITGEVIERSNKNKNIATGEIEITVAELKVLNASDDTPIEVTEEVLALEETRLKYRYLDMRRNEIKNKLITRHLVTMITRNILNDLGFIEVETPILCKSTPEGARDYLVPSRINPGSFYALPQSPQIFKQLLMVGGMEKYFQIAKCFRDEDLRADRQPEFTQIDLEMSFVDENDVQAVIEAMIKEIFKQVKGINLEAPFEKITYREAIDKYGSDRPDLRFDLPIKDITNILKDNDTPFLQGDITNAIVVKNGDSIITRKKQDEYLEFVKKYGNDKLLTIKYEEKLSGSIVKVLSETEQANLIKDLNLDVGDVILISIGNHDTIKQSLGHLRIKLAQDLNLIKSGDYKIVWVIDFPMFEYNEDEQRYVAMHHPFTSPKDEDIDKLETNPEEVIAKAYDLVINGSEIGGGSIRIHSSKIQNKVFEALGLSDTEINQKFGFFIEAFKYGAPPHGGIALGLERLMMVLLETDNVRDTIAFPKTSSATDLMSQAPSIVNNEQLAELGLKLK